jgi:hypothetical protein
VLSTIGPACRCRDKSAVSDQPLMRPRICPGTPCPGLRVLFFAKRSAGRFALRNARPRSCMYPRHFFDQFPPFPRSHQVFVAMSFDSRLESRWREVIAPAIGSVSIEGKTLEAHRVDTRRVSDSILTEILTGIGNGLLVFADLTSLDELNKLPLRNPNVFYEVGIAHATRLPEEVLLFRSDDGPLVFDVANIRVNRYNPDADAEGARAAVATAISAALSEIKLTRSMVVERYARRLDASSFVFLMTRRSGVKLDSPFWEGVAGRLLDWGLIEPTLGPISIERVKELLPGGKHRQLFSYHLTSLGAVVLETAMSRLGLKFKPEDPPDEAPK